MTAPGRPRPFACLWCGRDWQPGDADDLEARARLCPDCLGRAGENPFLRYRLHRALEERASRAAEPPAVAEPRPAAPVEPDPDDLDAWYLRRGRHARGPLHDAAWQMELDAATTWLDGLPLHGEIVELAAGTGWWSALLATRGELHAYDASGVLLDRARERLLAHRLRAHLHVRDPWSAPDRPVDGVLAAFGFGRAGDARQAAFARLLAAWPRPGGLVAVLEARREPAVLAVPAAVEPVAMEPATLADLLRAAGLVDVRARGTGRFFVLASGTVPEDARPPGAG